MRARIVAVEHTAAGPRFTVETDDGGRREGLDLSSLKIASHDKGALERKAIEGELVDAFRDTAAIVAAKLSARNEAQGEVQRIQERALGALGEILQEARQARADADAEASRAASAAAQISEKMIATNAALATVGSLISDLAEMMKVSNEAMGKSIIALAEEVRALTAQQVEAGKAAREGYGQLVAEHASVQDGKRAEMGAILAAIERLSETRRRMYTERIDRDPATGKISEVVVRIEGMGK